MQGSTDRTTEASASGRRGRRRGRFIAGVVLLLASSGMFGYLIWEYVGTNAVSKHRQAETVEAIRHGWAQSGPTRAMHSVIPQGAIGLLRVPRFGKGYEVPILAGFDSSTLARGVGWYAGGAAPGEVGNMVLAGHRVTRGEPFAHLVDVRAGDEVVIETRTQVFVYETVEDGDQISVRFTTPWPLWPVADADAAGEAPTRAMVTLVTCAEIFHTDQRLVVRGLLVSSETK